MMYLTLSSIFHFSRCKQMFTMKKHVFEVDVSLLRALKAQHFTLTRFVYLCGYEVLENNFLFYN